MGRYQDQVLCGVVPVQAGHLLFGRPWQFDKETTNMGRTNHYTLMHNKKKFTLAPLTPKEVYDLHGLMNTEKMFQKRIF